MSEKTMAQDQNQPKDGVENGLEEKNGQVENEQVQDYLEEEAIASPENFLFLQKELEESRVKANEYLDGWQRALADYANYKRRVERDQTLIYQNAAGSIIKQFVDVLDDLERALKNRPLDGEGATWASGIELIYRKLLSILENHGVKAMEVSGKFFDPNLHEAITSEESENHESGQIIDVVQQGYMLGERVLRPARVRVAK